MRKTNMKKKTTKSVKMNETVRMSDNEHRRQMKVNALKMAREIAAKHMAELSSRIDEIREKYRKDYPANIDGLVDEVQSTHNQIVSKCREELSQNGIGDYLNPEEVAMLISEEMLKARTQKW